MVVGQIHTVDACNPLLPQKGSLWPAPTCRCRSTRPANRPGCTKPRSPLPRRARHRDASATAAPCRARSCGRTDTPAGHLQPRRAPTDAACLPCRLRQDLPARAGLCVTGASAAWPWDGRPPVMRGCSMSEEQALGHPTLNGRPQWLALQAVQRAAGPLGRWPPPLARDWHARQAGTNLATLAWTTTVTDPGGRRPDLVGQ
jgi:hypothetical protein